MIDIFRSGLSIAVLTACLSAMADGKGGSTAAVGLGVSSAWVIAESIYLIFFRRDKQILQ